jgi:hypothetical protein
VGASGAWLRNSFSVGVAAHELGHNLGLNHANFWDTLGQSVAGPGISVEYGDIYDTMGTTSGGINHFNVRNKSYLSWLKTNEWVKVTGNGTYRLFAQDDPGSTSLRGLCIPKDNNTNYWVEFRQKNKSRWLMNGAGLRMAQNGNQQSQLLDTTPGSRGSKNDSCILIGNTYSDRNSGIHITPIGKGGTVPESLDVVVNLGPFSSNQSPVMQLAASTTSVGVGEVVSFDATASDPDGDPMSYYWDFGNGTIGANSSSATNSWSLPGEYAVRCVVSDMRGGLASQSKIIAVGSPSTYRITGRVSSASGPVQGVRVYISSVQMAYSDTDGSYSIPGVAAGIYTVKASLENYTVTNSSFANPLVVENSVTGIDFGANYSSSSPPVITTQPLSQTINQGGDVIFTVTAIGTPRLYYQWQFNNSPITGETSFRLLKAAVQPSDAGSYAVVVTNAGGSVQSLNAVLIINALPLSRPTLSTGSFTPNGQWQFNVIGNPNQRYVIESSSNLLDWKPDVTLTNVTGMVQYTDFNPRNSLLRFYRSKVLP